MSIFKRIKLMRGEEASRLSVTPSQGEQICTTDELKVYLGDGNKEGGFVVNVDNVIATWPDQSDASKKHSLAWWVDWLGETKATIRIPIGTHEILDDMIIPDNVCLSFDKGGMLKVAYGKTLTINGSIEAGLYQIFTPDSELAGEPGVDASYPEWFSAVGDGITDDSDAVSKWASTWSCVKRAKSKAIYKCQKEVKFKGSLVDGCNATFDFTDAPAVNFPAQACFLFEGDPLVEMPALGADIPELSRVINVVEEPDLKQSDIVVIYDSANGSFNKAKDVYRAGEFGKVFSVEQGTTGYDITLIDKTYAGYSAGSTVKLYKMENPVTVTVRNLHIIATLNGSITCLRIIRGHQCHIDNVRAEGSSYACISLINCFESAITNSHASKLSQDISGTSYGISVVNSQRIKVTNCFAEAVRHAYAMGGVDEIGCVPNRDIQCTHNTFITTGTSQALDAHGNCEYYNYSYNTVKGGIVIGGNNGVISNNQIDCSGANGIGIYFAECIGTNFTISDNTYKTNFIGNSGVGMFLDFGGVAGTFQGGQTNNGGTLRITGNNVQWGTTETVNGSGAIRIRNRAEAVNPFIIIIENNNFKAPVGINPQQAAGTIQLDTIVLLTQVIVLNNVMIGSGIYIKNTMNIFVKNNIILNSNNQGIYVNNSLTTACDTVKIESNYIDNTRTTGIVVNASGGQRYQAVRITDNIVKNNCQESSGSTSTNSPLYLAETDMAYVYDNNLGGGTVPQQQTKAYYNSINILYEKNNIYMGNGTIYYGTITNKYGQIQPAIEDETSEVTVAKFNSVLAALRNHRLISE